MPTRKADARAADPLDDPEFSPVAHRFNGARPIKTRKSRNGHWIGFLFLLPFLIMFVLHDPLGMTDAALMGDYASQIYNLMTVCALLFGSLAFLTHAFVLPIVKGRGWIWVPLKIIVLVLFWKAVILAIGFIWRNHIEL